MRKIRKGKDIVLRWSILTNGEAKPLEGRNLRFTITPPNRHVIVNPFTTEGNVLIARFRGVDQIMCGVYRITLWENYGVTGQTAVDSCDAFQLVPTTCHECDSDIDGLDMEVVEPCESDLAVGIQGLSAYEIAVEHGYTGSEIEWLDSIKGVDGKSAYELAVDNGFEGSVQEWLLSLKGMDGKSAYQTAVDNGFVGSEAEWLESLKVKGDSGNINFPTFRVNTEMHVIMRTDVASNKDRFDINKKGHFIFKY